MTPVAAGAGWPSVWRSTAASCGSVALLTLVAGCENATPGRAASGASAAREAPPPSIGQLLLGAATEEALSARVGTPPALCLPSRPGRRLCQWELGKKQVGWKPLAAAVGTRDKLNLICELPADGSRRAGETCAGFPRRSNKHLYELPTTGRGYGEDSWRARTMRVRERYQARARRQLTSSRTLTELSLFVGALPHSCFPLDDSSQSCLWRTSNHTYGHGTLVEFLGAPKSKKIRLTCVLPTDGELRAEESCAVEVGA